MKGGKSERELRYEARCREKETKLIESGRASDRTSESGDRACDASLVGAGPSRETNSRGD